MDPSLEIRKLPITIRCELIRLLELQGSWKKLMAVIPQFLYVNEYNCDIGLNNPAKYRWEEKDAIENAASSRVCSAEILLREWGTSGRVQPSLGHLRYLLEKAELFRAADYITDVLDQAKPVRPTRGPAAPVNLNSEELQDSETKRISESCDVEEAFNVPVFVQTEIFSQSCEVNVPFDTLLNNKKL